MRRPLARRAGLQGGEAAAGRAGVLGGAAAWVALLLAFPAVVAGAGKDLTEDYLDLPGSFSFVRRAPQGAEPGRVKMLVFEDFLCPLCYDLVTRVVEPLKARYGDRLEVAFAAYPVAAESSSVPAQAYAVARAMGIGAEMQEALFRARFEERVAIDTGDGLAWVASRLGLDAQHFLARLEAGDGRALVERELALGRRYHIEGVPGVVLEGWIRVNDLSRQNLETIIGGLLARKGIGEGRGAQ